MTKENLIIGARLGLATLAAAAGLSGGGAKPERPADFSLGSRAGVSRVFEPGTALADENIPPIHWGPDGLAYRDAHLRTAGRVVIFNGPNGVQLSTGERYGGRGRPASVLIVANSDELNIQGKELTCGGGISTDVDEVGGSNYPERVKVAGGFFDRVMIALMRKTGQSRHEVSLIASRAENGTLAPLDEISNNRPGDVADETQPCVPEAPAERLVERVVERVIEVPAVPPALPECPVTWEMPGIFRATGISSVGVTNIDIARPERGFNWRDLPSSMRAFFAEPGGLLVDRNKIPSESLSQWDNIVRNSKGAVNFVNPQNQQVFQGSEFSGDIPWKGYAMFSLEEGRLTIPDKDACLTLTLLQRLDRPSNYLVFVKGRNGDQALQRTARIDRAVGGHALYQRLDNAAFGSVDQLNQLAAESKKIASRVTVVGFDLNTGAMVIAEQDRGSSTWRHIIANYTGV